MINNKQSYFIIAVIKQRHLIYYWHPPWQAATVPSPVGKISSLGWWHGMHLPTVSTWNNPYLIVTRYFSQLIKPSTHEQLKQTPENQWVPCSRTMPFSSVQAGRESLVQVIFPLLQVHLVMLLPSHSCPSTKAFPWESQHPLSVFWHSTFRLGVHVHLNKGFGFQLCHTS